MNYLSFLLCLLTAAVAIFHILSTKKKDSRSNQKRLPPGLPPLPIFGNLFSLGTQPRVSLAELAKTYGPVMTLQLGRVPTVVISSAEAAKEAFQKNDLSFSNRMVLDAISALNHHQKSIVFLPASPQWRNLRKICNSQVFSTSRLDASQSLRRTKVDDLLSYIQMSSKSGTVVDIGQAAFTTTLLLSSTLFSVDLGDPNSEIAREMKATIRGILEEAGKPNLSDYFPVLRRFDPQGIRQRMSIHFSKMKTFFNNMIEQRLQQSKNSPQHNDVLNTLLGINNQENSEEIDPSDIPDFFLDLFVAGTDTTSSTTEWAMAELLKNPKNLTTLQSELDKTIPKGSKMDENNLTQIPYLQAVIKETMTMHPPVPFLVPRKVLNKPNITILGLKNPQNAQVLVNVWAIGRDNKNWERPSKFKP